MIGNITIISPTTSVSARRPCVCPNRQLLTSRETDCEKWSVPSDKTVVFRLMVLPAGFLRPCEGSYSVLFGGGVLGLAGRAWGVGFGKSSPAVRCHFPRTAAVTAPVARSALVHDDTSKARPKGKMKVSRTVLCRTATRFTRARGLISQFPAVLRAADLDGCCESINPACPPKQS